MVDTVHYHYHHTKSTDDKPSGNGGMPRIRQQSPLVTTNLKMHVILLLVAISSWTVYCDYDYSSYYYLNCSKQELSGVIGESRKGSDGFKIKISDNSDKYVPGNLYTSMS